MSFLARSVDFLTDSTPALDIDADLYSGKYLINLFCYYIIKLNDVNNAFIHSYYNNFIKKTLPDILIVPKRK